MKTFDLKVGQVIDFYHYYDHEKKHPVQGTVLGVQEATKYDRESSDLLHWIWFLNSKNEVCVATHDADGTICWDDTWTDFTDFNHHPYEHSLNAAGYRLSKENGYWEAFKK